MFPKENLDCEFVNEEGSLELFILIKRTTPDNKKKKEKISVRETRYLELQRFIHARKLSGTLDETREQLMKQFISLEEKAQWEQRH